MRKTSSFRLRRKWSTIKCPFSVIPSVFHQLVCCLRDPNGETQVIYYLMWYTRVPSLSAYVHEIHDARSYVRTRLLVTTQIRFISVMLLLFLTFSVLVANPKKTTLLHGGQSRSWCAEQGKENKRKSLGAYPPPPHPPTLLVRKK